MPAVNTNDWLSMTQVKADLMLAKSLKVSVCADL